jgi:hypothetical protein
MKQGLISLKPPELWRQLFMRHVMRTFIGGQSRPGAIRFVMLEIDGVGGRGCVII